MGIQERKKLEKAHRRQHILSVTKKIVAAKGFRNTTIDDIAREAELSPTTIYLYFDSKEELFISLTFQSLQYLNLRLGEVLAIHGKADLNIKSSALQDVLSDAYEFNPLIFENMFHLLGAENLGSMTPTLRVKVKHLFNSIIDNLTAIFTENDNCNESALNAGELVNLFFTLLSGISIWSGISDQLLEDNMSDGCHENCDVMMDLFRYRVNSLQTGITKGLQAVEG